jgi:hypothetical protein
MLRLGARTVQAPSGQEWHIGRRWIGRPMPRWRKMRSRKTRKADGGRIDAAEALFSVPDFNGLDDLGAAVLIVLALVVIALVLVPLLMFGIELVLLGLLAAAGIVGRTLLGRPWIVQAIPSDDKADTLTWPVVGWRRSARVIQEVATSLEAGRDPTLAEATDLLPAT